jgi:receptor protein-tyrosine kinase
MGLNLKAPFDLEQFGQLRARIEAMFPEPAIIVVTSATAGDGKSATSLGLAKALADADGRVLYVDGNAVAPTLDRSFIVPSWYADVQELSQLVRAVPGQRFSALSFADRAIEKAMSLDKVKAIAATMRAQYDFIIVDTGPLVQSDMAVLFASIADGTLVTLRLGRFPASADKELVEALSRVRAEMIGAVTVAPRFMKHFAAARQASSQLALPKKRRRELGKHESALALETGDVTSSSAAS